MLKNVAKVVVLSIAAMGNAWATNGSETYASSDIPSWNISPSFSQEQKQKQDQGQKQGQSMSSENNMGGTKALGLGWTTSNTPNGAPANSYNAGCVQRKLLEEIWALQNSVNEADKSKADFLLARTFAYPVAMGHSGESAFHMFSFAFGRGKTNPDFVSVGGIPLPVCAEEIVVERKVEVKVPVEVEKVVEKPVEVIKYKDRVVYRDKLCTKQEVICSMMK